MDAEAEFGGEERDKEDEEEAEDDEADADTELEEPADITINSVRVFVPQTVLSHTPISRSTAAVSKVAAAYFD